MGNGVRSTHRAAIPSTITKSVRFGKTEVRVFEKDNWETKPLLNTHEVRRIEAKIRASEMKPMEKPKIIQAPLVKKQVYSTHPLVVLVTLGFATAILCGLIGPLGLILPAVYLTAWVFRISSQPHSTPAVSNEERLAASKAILHLEKLAKKHKQSGLDVQYNVYINMVDDCKRKYRL